MIFALAKLSSVIPDFNARSLTVGDFFNVAASENITVVFDDMPTLKGFCVRSQGRDYIFLDRELTGVELVATAFHELAHCLLHVSRGRQNEAMFYGLARPCAADAEADAGAVVCLYPITEIHELVYRLKYVSEFEVCQIKRRLAIFKEFGV
jgi:hypothetical protein